MSANFSRLVEDFFQKYLVAERDLSPNTVLAYRDAMKLVLTFVSARVGRDPDGLHVEDFDSECIRAFLDWLTSERGCSNRTLNQRLATLKTFFRYVASRAPEHLDRCRSIREIANRRFEAKIVGHLEQEQVAPVLKAARSTGRHRDRDGALMTLMLNTGARVQEIVDLSVQDLRLDATPKVRIRGKGRKHRDCPLWKSTVELLRGWLAKRRSSELKSEDPLFVNYRGQRLSRSGVAYIVNRVAAAANIPATVDRKCVTPHTIRHTTAMELLRANADITVIAAWLGHATLGTTHQYVEIDLRMKQAAIAEATAVLPVDLPSELPTDGLLEWLERLGEGQDYVQTCERNLHSVSALKESQHITANCT